MDTITKTNISKEDLEIKTEFIKSAIPIFEEIIELLEKNKGWIPSNDKITDFVSRMNPPWCTLYEDKERLLKLSYYLCFGDEIINEESLKNFIKEATDELKQADSTFILTDETIDEYKNEFEKHPDEDKSESIQHTLRFIYVFITSLFNYIALMIHGRSMCQLITDAKNGDDEAFCLAAQIDRTVLQLPCFQQRLLKSQFSNDEIFLNKLAARIKKPIIQSKIRYRTLMLAFAMLDDLKLLDMPHEKLLDICEEIGVTGDEHGINDIDKFRKRLHEYKKKKRN